jgi:hypothetical protein
LSANDFSGSVVERLIRSVLSVPARSIVTVRVIVFVGVVVADCSPDAVLSYFDSPVKLKFTMGNDYSRILRVMIPRGVVGVAGDPRDISYVPGITMIY